MSLWQVWVICIIYNFIGLGFSMARKKMDISGGTILFAIIFAPIFTLLALGVQLAQLFDKDGK